MALALAAPAGAVPALAQENGLRLNDREYFETRGLNVLVFSNEHNGMFFDEKTAGIEIIQHGVCGWPPAAPCGCRRRPSSGTIPKVIERKVDKAAGTITCPCTGLFNFDSRLVGDRRGLSGPGGGVRGQAGAREARRAGRPQPRSSCRRAFRADLPGRRQARDLPALPDRTDRDQAGATRRSPSSRGHRPSTTGAATSTSRRSWPPARRSCSSRGSRAPRRHQGRQRRAAAPRRAQPRPERLVHRPVAAGHEDDGEGGRMGGRPERGPELDPGTPVIGFSQVGYHPSQKKVAVGSWSST